MSFKVRGIEYEGCSMGRFMGAISSDLDVNYRFTKLKSFLENGGNVYVEFQDGARKGTVGRLNIKPEDCESLYRKIEVGLYEGNYEITQRDWEIVFDDTEKTIGIKIERQKPLKWRLHFGQMETKWVFTTKERPKVDPKILKDHFGEEIKVDQVVMFMHGKGNDYEVRFGKVKRISEKGTVWIEAFATMADHKVEIFNHGIHPKNIFILDGDQSIKDRAMLAKMKYT